MLASLFLFVNLSWQPTIGEIIRDMPKFANQVVKVCVDKECIVVDLTKTTFRARAPKKPSLTPLEKEIHRLLENAGVAQDDNSLNIEGGGSGDDGTKHAILVVVKGPNG